MDVLYEGLGISKLQFFIKKIKKISAVFFSLILVIKTLNPNPDPELDPDSMNPDLQRRNQGFDE
jgi:hypothetical protein